ncbi:MAG: Fe-S cluster assembly protein SufD, partial [Verrucomicrobiota bacterium]
MSTSIATGFNEETHQLFLSGREEPEWLHSFRREARADFDRLAWPTRNEEEWIRTDIRLFKPDKYAVTSAPIGDPEVTPLLSQGVELGGQSITVNGVRTTSELSETYQQQGVVFGSLEQAIESHGDLVEQHLGRAVTAGFDRFSALNAAYWSGGHFLYVPKGVVVEHPFHALSVLSDGATDFGRILVILEEGAEATFL